MYQSSKFVCFSLIFQILKRLTELQIIQIHIMQSIIFLFHKSNQIFKILPIPQSPPILQNTADSLKNCQFSKSLQILYFTNSLFNQGHQIQVKSYHNFSMFFILSRNCFNYDMTSFLVGGFERFFGTGGAWRTHMRKVHSSNRGVDRIFFQVVTYIPLETSCLWYTYQLSAFHI